METFLRTLFTLLRSTQISPSPLYPVSLRSILILPSHVRLGRSGLFTSGFFPTKTLHAFLFSPLVPYLVAFIARSEDNTS